MNRFSCCPKCHSDVWVAVVSDCGRYWNADGCMTCHATWTFQVPRAVGEIAEGVRRVTMGECKGMAKGETK